MIPKECQKKTRFVIQQVNNFTAKTRAAIAAVPANTSYMPSCRLRLSRIHNESHERWVDLKCKAFYGCYFAYAPKSPCPCDDSTTRSKRWKIVSGGGRNTTYYRGRTQCWSVCQLCYSSILSKMAGMHIRDALASGADCIVTPQFICANFNLDSPSTRKLKSHWS